MASEEQLEELEALHSIYDEDITELSTHPPCFMIKLSNIAQNLKGSISIKISLPVEYPSVVPKIELPMRSKLISKENQQYLLQHLNNVAGESVGMAMVFTLVDSAEQWINDNVTNEDEDEPEIQEEASAQVDITPVNLKEPKVTGGRWEYVIGLVGKPSAGKSTFFNAATSLDLARTGAHPFTTIEPNIGKAFYSIPCPCQKLSQRCHAAYGHNFSGQRHIPVLLKDVAGLVPGAWEGKGRGNRFLNDLLDADVLIHIIDVSGKTNEKGEETEDYDPRNDIQWLRDELHLWIYQNVFSKWDNIVKRPSKLIDMFTGYHANRATIFTALSNAGISDRELSTVSTWDKSVLHKIVDNFLQVRFPMMLVLNKADLDTSFSNTEKLSADIDNVIAVSARSECLLQKLSKEGIIGYEHGGTEFHIISDLSINDPIRQQLQDLENVVLKRYGSTNVHEALCHAVRLRQPVYAFPVHCLDTLQSIGKPHSGGQVILKDCISLKPGTTVEELYIAMCHYPVNLINGDFVRAETLKEDGKKRPMRKDEEIGERSCILKIMTTKRTS